VSKRLVYLCDWLPPDLGAVGQYAVLSRGNGPMNRLNVEPAVPILRLLLHLTQVWLDR
jgi:hypothetical protein